MKLITLLFLTTVLLAQPKLKIQQKHLNHTLNVWQKKLDFKPNIDFKVVTKTEYIETALTYGIDPTMMLGYTFLNGNQVWVVRILDAHDYPKWADKDKVKRDQENTTVHEFLHVLYMSKPQEYFVSTIADVLIKEK